MSLGALESCEIDVGFDPDTSGHFATALSLISFSREVLDSAVVTGRGVEPIVTLSSTAIAFGHQTINKAGAPRELLMTNSGSETLALSSVAVDGAFSEADDCGDSLATQGSCTIELSFEPTAVQDYTGALTITDDVSDSPQTVALSGTGVSAGAPQASLSASTLAFGSVAVGSQEGPQNVTLSNSGTEDLSVTSVVVEGEESHSFGKEDDCHESTLAAGESCTIQITFAPATTGELTATVSIQDNTGDSPQHIALSGTGTEAGGGGSGCALTPATSASAIPALLLISLSLIAIHRHRRERDFPL